MFRITFLYKMKETSQSITEVMMIIRTVKSTFFLVLFDKLGYNDI